MPRFKIVFEVEHIVDADCYEEAIMQSFPKEGFIRIVSLAEIKG